MGASLAVALYVAAMMQAGRAASTPQETAASWVATAFMARADAYLAGIAGPSGGRSPTWHSPAGPGEDPLRPVMQKATALGSGQGLAAVVAVAALLDPEAASAAAKAGAGAGLVTLAHKAVLGRARPAVGAGAFAAKGPFSLDDLYQSLPSGHTSAATAVFGALGRAYPGAAPALEAMGVLVGLSRVYLGSHWPSDVAAARGLGSWWAESAAGTEGRASPQ